MPHLPHLLSAAALLGTLGAPCVSGHAQWSDAAHPLNQAHERALEAYENQQYALALHTFEGLMSDASSTTSDAYAEAAYYAAMSALALWT